MYGKGHDNQTSGVSAEGVECDSLAAETGEWIEFGSAFYPGWEDVVDYLLDPEQRDGKTINRALINDTMVEQTIATLDAYSKLLNDNYDGSREEYKKIMNLATLTNKWLKASGEEDESAYYID